MEKIALTTPITPQSLTTSEYVVRSLTLGWDDERITIVLRDNHGRISHHSYDGAPAVALMRALNKANLSTNSLHRRILTQLAADGKVPSGSVTGAPD